MDAHTIKVAGSSSTEVAGKRAPAYGALEGDSAADTKSTDDQGPARGLVISTGTSSALTSPAALVAAAKGYAKNAKAEATRDGYAYDWQRFEQWCNERGLESLPAEPVTVALYLTFRAEQGRRVATIKRELTAVSMAHKAKGLPSPRSDAAVKTVVDGITRTLLVAPVQKAPLLPEELHAAVLQLPASLLGIRDRALLTLGFAGAFRRSELAALEVADVNFVEQGMKVLVRRSKTDQEGVGLEKAIPFGAYPETCPVAAVKAWLKAAAITTGPVFRRVTRHGVVGTKQLDGGSIARVVKRAVAATGQSPVEYSGHSLRAGLITAATLAGKTEASIMRHTGHRSTEVLRRYIRLADLFTDSCVSGIGL